MPTTLQASTILNNGVKMPWLGLGVFKAKEGQEVAGAVKAAIQAGYRSIDTASLYGNEEGVGQAIREAGLSRDELFITTMPKKILCREKRFPRVNKRFTMDFSA